MRLRLILPTVLTASMLAACGGSPTATVPTTAPEPTTRPTSTPRPTAKPTDEPVAEPTEEPTAEPTAETTEQTTADVDMGNLETYTHESGIFSLDVPSSWSADDNSSEGEVLVRFSDEYENAVILANLLDMDRTLDEEELTELLTSYLDDTYKAQANFSQDEPSTQKDGSILVVWGYDAELDTGETTRLLGNSFIEQRDNLVSVLTIAVPDEQFTTLESSINDVLSSYSLDTSMTVADATSGGTTTTTTTTDSGSDSQLLAVEMEDLTTYTHQNDLFSIDVPEKWTLQDNSKPGEAITLWTDPTGNSMIVVDVLKESSERTTEELTTLLQDFLNGAFSEEPDFLMEEPVPQEDGSTLIVWSYTATADNDVQAKLLGNSFIEQRGDKVAILTLAVPEEQFETLRPDISSVLGSYSINESADVP